jgi:DNA-binding beta-propeller fold protein YncE
MTIRQLAVTLTLAAAATTLGAQPAPRVVALVANQASGSATLVDVASGATAEIPVGAGPHEAAILPGAQRGVVTVYGVAGAPGNQLAIIDLVKQAVERTIDLGQYTRPHGVVAVPGSPNLVAVTSETTQNLVIVNVETGAIVRVIPTNAPTPHMAALPSTGPAAGARAYTANIRGGSTSELDLTTGALIRVIPVASMTEGIAVTPDGREVWLGSNDRSTVSVVDVAKGAVAATIEGFRFPYRLGISADGRTAVVVDPPNNAIFVVDVATRLIRGRIDNLDSPRGVSIASDGKSAMITSAEASSVILVDLVTLKELRRFPVGNSPDGVGYASP